MPNWCMTAYTIEGNKRTLNRIKNAITDCLTGKFPKEQKSDPSWEGNVLSALGISFKDNDGTHLYAVRGFINESTTEKGALKIYAEEAWSRTDFAELIQKKFPSISIYWIAEEPGCDIFQTNDSEGKYYPYRYWVDTCIGNDCMSEYFETEEDAYNWISMISECKTPEDVDAFNENRAKADTDEYIYVHEFDVV